MSKATYILGTSEYVVLEIECDRPGITFVPADWSAQIALTEFGSVFDDSGARWANAILETVDKKDYAKALIGDLLSPVAAGHYRAVVRATKTQGGTEIPLLRATGTIAIERA